MYATIIDRSRCTIPPDNRLFVVEADYKISSPIHPLYRISAKTEKEAKRIFKDRISYMKIYSIKEYPLKENEIFDRYKMSIWGEINVIEDTYLKEVQGNNHVD